MRVYNFIEDIFERFADFLGDFYFSRDHQSFLGFIIRGTIVAIMFVIPIMTPVLLFVYLMQ